MLRNVKLVHQTGWYCPATGFDAEAALEQEYAMPSLGQIVCSGGARGAPTHNDGVIISRVLGHIEPPSLAPTPVSASAISPNEGSVAAPCERQLAMWIWRAREAATIKSMPSQANTSP